MNSNITLTTSTVPTPSVLGELTFNSSTDDIAMYTGDNTW